MVILQDSYRCPQLELTVLWIPPESAYNKLNLWLAVVGVLKKLKCPNCRETSLIGRLYSRLHEDSLSVKGSHVWDIVPSYCLGYWDPGFVVGLACRAVPQPPTFAGSSFGVTDLNRDPNLEKQML